jgi:hypothetical protein
VSDEEAIAETRTRLQRRLEELRPAADRLGTTALLEQLDPTTCEGAAQLAGDDPHAAAAGLVARTLG